MSSNLRPPWPPGRSGNPGGRPKGRSLTSHLRDGLDRELKTGKTVAEVLVNVLLRIALKGNREAIKDIFERVEGKPTQAVELSGPDGESLAFDWNRLQTVLLGALAPFPEARVRVALALRGMVDDVRDDDAKQSRDHA